MLLLGGCDAGNVAIFTDKGGYIINKNAVPNILAAVDKCENKMNMHRENGVYNFRIKVPREGEVQGQNIGARRSTHMNNRYAALAEYGEDGEDMTAGFGRQGNQ